MIHIDDLQALKRWILQALRKFSVSNPTVLATYTISVVNRGESSLEQLRKSCLDELETFLKGQTSRFVDLLMDALADGSYQEVDYGDVEDENGEHGAEWNQEHGHDEFGNDDADEDDHDDDDRGRRRYREEQPSEDIESNDHHNNSSSSKGNTTHDNKDNRDRLGRSDYQDRNRDRDRGGSNWRDRPRDRDNRDINRDRDREREKDRDNYRQNGNGMGSDRDRKRPRDYDGRREYDRQGYPPQQPPPVDGGLPPPWAPPVPAGPPTGYNPYDPYAPNVMGYGWGQPPMAPGYMGHPYAPPVPYMYGAAYGVHHYLPPPVDNLGYTPPPFPPMNKPVDTENPQPPSSIQPTNDTPVEDTSTSENLQSGEPVQQTEVSPTSENTTVAASDYTYGVSTTASSAPQPQIPVAYHNYGVNSYNMPPANSSNTYNVPSTSGSNGNGNYSKKPRTGHASNQLPESERCTLRCTGIPTYVKEEDLKNHFEAFGHVVELQLSPMVSNTDNFQQDKDEEGGSEKKKTYNECLVQFFSSANAKKCFTSPSPVLNNRFIHVHMSKFNIIPPSDVEPPSQDIIERDHQLLSQDIIPSQLAAANPQNRKKPGMVFTKGVTNKWKRGDESKTAPKPSDEGGQPNSEDAVQDVVADSSNPSAEASKKPVETEASKEGLELKQNFEQLKTLKQQAEENLKKKESVLQSQLEQCRSMMQKLEKMAESDSKVTLVHNLEVKIVGLQAQLRTVHDQIEKGQLVEKQSPPAKVPGSYYNPMGYRPHGGRIPSGRFYGGRNYYPPGGGRGRGYMGGRGAFMESGYSAQQNQVSTGGDQAAAMDGGVAQMEESNAEQSPAANLGQL